MRGGRALIATSRPVIMFESGPEGIDDYQEPKREMWRWLHEEGYEILVPNRVAHGGDALTCDGFVESHHFPRRTSNYFAVPTDSRNEVREHAYAAPHRDRPRTRCRLLSIC